MNKPDQTKPARSARCDCRDNHSTWSARCAQKIVVDPTRFLGDVIICESCRKFCFWGCDTRLEMLAAQTQETTT